MHFYLHLKYGSSQKFKSNTAYRDPNFVYRTKYGPSWTLRSIFISNPPFIKCASWWPQARNKQNPSAAKAKPAAGHKHFKCPIEASEASSEGAKMQERRKRMAGHDFSLRKSKSYLGISKKKPCEKQWMICKSGLNCINITKASLLKSSSIIHLGWGNSYGEFLSESFFEWQTSFSATEMK